MVRVWPLMVLCGAGCAPPATLGGDWEVLGFGFDVPDNPILGMDEVVGVLSVDEGDATLLTTWGDRFGSTYRLELSGPFPRQEQDAFAWVIAGQLDERGGESGVVSSAMAGELACTLGPIEDWSRSLACDGDLDLGLDLVATLNLDFRS